MALQFVLGNSGAGKSYYVYKKITEQSKKYPDKNYMVLVPEQFTMQTQKDLVLMSEKKGIMNIDVLSFIRLAHRVFEEAGTKEVPVLDDEGKSLILRRIAANYEGQLKVLKGNIKKLGYISEVKSVISEFVQYDIGYAEIEQVMEAAGEDSYLYYKLQDIKLLYEGFRQYLKDRYITKEELLDVLCDIVPNSTLLKNSTVVLDGFTGFTPVQARLLARLMLRCVDVWVTVTVDLREDPYSYAEPQQMFGLGKHMIHSLLGIAKEHSIVVRESHCCSYDPVYRFKDTPALGFLERELFRHSGRSYKEDQQEIEIHCARNPRDEAVFAASLVRRLVRVNGYRYRDIGVIVSDIKSYSDYLEQSFESFGIPIFMDSKRSILLNAFVEYLRSLVAMAEQNFTYESVFRFLKTGYAGFKIEEVELLENYVLACGIRGYKKWQETWLWPLKAMGEGELQTLNHLRVLFVEKLDALVFVLKQRKKTVRDITSAIYSFMAEEQIQLILKNQEETFKQAGEPALAKEYAQVYAIVLELFDKFVELLGDEQVSVAEYAKLLDAGLDEAKVGVIPPGLDEVVIGDMKRTRLKDVKALIFLGANDTFLPGSLVSQGLLSERDREKFTKQQMNLTPGVKEQAYIQKFYLYLNLTRPTKHLYICYSKVSPSGKTVRPSYLVQEIRKLFPGIPVMDEEQKTLREKELTPATGMDELIEGMRLLDDAAGSAWMEMYRWYKKQGEWSDKLERLLDAGSSIRPADGISRRVAKRLYGEGFQDSITRMEKFASCEFAHFLSYGLRLSKREEYSFRSLDFGNVLHRAIEVYSIKAGKAEGGFSGLSPEEQEYLVKESMEEATAGYGNLVLYSSARSEAMIRRMEKLLHRTVWALSKQLGQGDFRPEAYELRFGNGKIDRVDTCIDGDTVYVNVIDYKTGMAAFDSTALYYGLQLQLMVYLDAAINNQRKKYPGKEVVPAGVFYYRIQDPFILKTLEMEDDKVREQALLKELRLEGLVNEKQEALRHLDRTESSESVVIPVKHNKDGSLSKSSKAVGEEDFAVMTGYAVRKMNDIHEQILSGETAVNPYREGTRTACDYCGYRHICGFEKNSPGCEYREMDKMDRSEAIARMKGER